MAKHDMKIRVLIADDHALVAQGLFSLVAQAEMEVTALVKDGREAVHRAMEDRPDVVLMDIEMPSLNGNEATRIIRERSPQTQVIILSAYSDPVHVCGALQAGAAGYLAKKSAAKELVDAIRTVHEGGYHLSGQLTEGLMYHVIHKIASEAPLVLLSSREQQVLQLHAEGRSVIDIAEELSLSPNAVETDRASMLQKLGIGDLASLIRFVIRRPTSPQE